MRTVGADANTPCRQTARSIYRTDTQSRLMANPDQFCALGNLAHRPRKIALSLYACGFPADFRPHGGYGQALKLQIQTLHSRNFAQRYKRQQFIFHFLMVAVLTCRPPSDGENMLLKHTLIVTAIAMIAVSGCKKTDDPNAPATATPPATQQAMPPVAPPAPAPSAPDATPAAPATPAASGASSGT